MQHCRPSSFLIETLELDSECHTEMIWGKFANVFYHMYAIYFVHSEDVFSRVCPTNEVILPPLFCPHTVWFEKVQFDPVTLWKFAHFACSWCTTKVCVSMGFETQHLFPSHTVLYTGSMSSLSMVFYVTVTSPIQAMYMYYSVFTGCVRTHISGNAYVYGKWSTLLVHTCVDMCEFQCVCPRLSYFHIHLAVFFSFSTLFPSLTPHPPHPIQSIWHGTGASMNKTFIGCKLLDKLLLRLLLYSYWYALEPTNWQDPGQEVG